MECKINSTNPPILHRFPTKKPELLRAKTLSFSSSSYSQNKEANTNNSTTSSSSSTQIQTPKPFSYTVNFTTLRGCKLGISRYPDFEYDAEGGKGSGFASKVMDSTDFEDEVSVSFDIETLYIPPLTTATTKFLGLPLPPFLKIVIVPEFFNGRINQDSGKVNLEFKAKFLFSAGNIYRAPPLLVRTVLTSEELRGTIRSGRGERLNKDGKCRLIGVATVDPIDDFLMNAFLGLPTECIAQLNAIISLSN